jgi:hypothetical protein
MLYRLFALLVISSVVVGCTDSFEPGTAVTSLTICTESAEHYTDCMGREVKGVSRVIYNGAGGVAQLEDVDLDSCRTTYYISSRAPVIGDEEQYAFLFRYSLGQFSDTVRITIDFNDTAKTVTLPCD